MSMSSSMSSHYNLNLGQDLHCSAKESTVEAEKEGGSER